jgi:hypothetical protein
MVVLSGCARKPKALSKGLSGNEGEPRRCPRVSVVNLLAQPRSFHGQRLQVTGYLALEGDATLLYLSEEAYKQWQFENAVYVLVDTSEAKKALKGSEAGWVEMEGVFDATEKGTSGCVPGGIEVQRIGPWPPGPRIGGRIW